MRKIPWVAILVATLTLAGCGSRASGDGVSEQQARQVLETAVQRTLNGDFKGLCELAADADVCTREMASDLRKRTPKVRPNVACAYRLPDTRDTLGRTVVVGGQVLVVEGADAEGHPFQTEVLVFNDGKRLVAQNILWWSGMGIATQEPGKPGTTAGLDRQGCK